MRFKKTPNEKTDLDKAIDEVMIDMKGFTSETDEYAKMVVQLDKLHKLKDAERPKRVSPDTLAIVLGNLTGIILIVGYERANVVTSKALTLLAKLR